MKLPVITATLLCAFLIQLLPAPAASAAPDAETIKVIKALVKDGAEKLKNRNYEDALAAFDEALRLDPNHGRARLDRGRSLLGLQRYREARKTFQEVLEKDNPPVTVRRHVERYLQLASQAGNRTTLQSQVTVGALYDDNVNYGPIAQTIDIAPIDFGFVVVDELTLSPEAQPHASAGLLSLVNAAVSHDLGRRDAWSASSGVSYYQTHLDKHTEYETLLFGANAGFNYVRGNRAISIPYQFQHIQQGEKTVARIHGINPAISMISTDNRRSMVRTRFEYRDFNASDARDAWYTEAGYDQRQQLSRELGLYGTLSAGILGEFADEDYYSNYGLRTGGALETALPLGVKAGLKVDYKAKWYDGKDILTQKDRVDQELVSTLALTRQAPLKTNVSLVYQHTENFSNVALYEYRRNLTMLNLSKKF